MKFSLNDKLLGKQLCRIGLFCNQNRFTIVTNYAKKGPKEAKKSKGWTI